ncbi:MAG TPA: transposase [Candidatus Babeliales bacterium]|nr:transposase [Candidatus Babeliales bacterium]
MNRIPDDFWNVIKEIISAKKNRVGRPEMCSRKALEGIFYTIKAGSPWHMLPAELGKPTTVHGKFRK